MSENKSNFHIYSLGIVAMNKKLDEKVILVTPIEDLMMLDGELVSNQTETTATGVDAQGKTYTTKVTTDRAIEALWLPWGSNRHTPPDVRRGERVLLFKFSGNNQFFWKELGWDDHLRRLETVVYQWSDIQDEDKNPLELENNYSLEVSTHLGQVTLRTAKANGEYCLYAFQIDAKNGKVTLTDDLGNTVTLDSANTKIELINALKSKVVLDKQKILAHADDSITLDATKLIHLTTKDFKMECETVTVKNTTSTFDTTNTTFTGNVTINKDTQVDGKLTINGQAAFNAEVTFAKPITCAGITSSKPIHGPSNTI